MTSKLRPTILAALLLTLPACATETATLDLGNRYMDNGRYDVASRVYDDVISLDPTNAAAWNNRGIARARLGQTVGALGDYSHAIELSPRDPELYLNRGDAYLALGNYEYAIQDFTRATQLAPQYAKAYFNRGTARLRAGDRAGAEADWRYAISIEPDPWTQAAMVRSAGLGAPAVRDTVAAIPGTLPGSSVVVTAPPAASPVLDPLQRLDARALTTRAITRDLDGDRAGAIADLRTAVAIEQDPARRASIERVLRALEGAQ